MVLAKISTKTLYTIQVIVMQEVQSCVRIDAVELQEIKSDKEEVEIVVEQVKFETIEEKENIDKIE
jgi:hypothetical protein